MDSSEIVSSKLDHHLFEIARIRMETEEKQKKLELKKQRNEEIMDRIKQLEDESTRVLREQIPLSHVVTNTFENIFSLIF